jgi:hypothetical protein
MNIIDHRSQMAGVPIVLLAPEIHQRILGYAENDRRVARVLRAGSRTLAMDVLRSSKRRGVAQ